MQYNDAKIILNHVGFMPGSSKVFAIKKPAQKEFAIYHIWDELTCGLEDKKPEPRFKGVLKKNGTELSDAWTGDFSEFDEEGTYRIHCGDDNSRCFVIYNNAYSTVMRTLFNHFPWTRCGNTVTGWASPCHTEKDIIKETGKKVDLEGGYHQSSDLRKWSFGLSQAMVGLSNYALLQNPVWDQEHIADEIKWGARYFLKLMREDGGLPYTICQPHDWGPTEYYLADSPPPDHWNTIRFLSQSALYFKDKDKDNKLSQHYTAAALKVWDYMLNKYDRKKPYHFDKYPPIGHSALMVWYNGFYEDSANDLAYRMSVANNLFVLTRDKKFLDHSIECANKFVELNVLKSNGDKELGSLFWESEDCNILINSYMYFWYTAGPLGLCDLVEITPGHPDNKKWKKCIENVAYGYVCMSNKNPWGLVPSFWFVEGNNPFEGVNIYSHSEEKYKKIGKKYIRGPGIRSNTENGKILKSYYDYHNFVYNIEIASISVFLSKAYRLTGKKEYMYTAQRQLDWIAGFNPYDSSSIEAVGYNQPHRGVFGEFFPPTPQIPGAVSVGINKYSFEPEGFGMDNEYDFPITASVMWAFAEIIKSMEPK